MLWFSSAYYLLAFTTSGESVLFASFSTRAAKTSKEAMIADNGSVVSACHSPANTEEAGDSCNSVTNRSRRGLFGIRCHRASPRPVAFLGPLVFHKQRPHFSGCLSHRATKRKIDCPRYFKSEQFCTDSLFEIEQTEWFETPKPSAQVFRFKLKIFGCSLEGPLLFATRSGPSSFSSMMRRISGPHPGLFHKGAAPSCPAA